MRKFLLALACLVAAWIIAYGALTVVIEIGNLTGFDAYRLYAMGWGIMLGCVLVLVLVCCALVALCEAALYFWRKRNAHR